MTEEDKKALIEIQKISIGIILAQAYCLTYTDELWHSTRLISYRLYEELNFWISTDAQHDICRSIMHKIKPIN